MKISIILKKAKQLINKPEKWCKGSYVKRDAKGKALAYCAVGALDEASPNRVGYEAGCIFKKAVHCPRGIVVWNDNRRRTHNEVMASFDKAIALATKEKL